jgi:hypothetical protein
MGPLGVGNSRKLLVCGQGGETATLYATLPAQSTPKAVLSLYLSCYLEPTSHMHATSAGVEARIERAVDAWTCRLNTDKESGRAVHLGHNVLLLDIGVQNDYFKLGLDKDKRPRLEAFLRIWSSKSKSGPSNSS